MRLSKYFIPTLKELPSDVVVPSHKLMLRAGMIRPLSAGIYSFLPLGYRVLKKAIEIIRDELDSIGGQEFHLPALNPIELWEKTGRASAFGDILFQIKNKPYVLAPTHEEVMCFIAYNHIRSYRDLPQIWYQIQTKFRNEPRPRSGVIRGRQFLMMDSYSLDASFEGLNQSYELHASAYRKIFDRVNLKYFVVSASSGVMGGSGSQEFMIESELGEDTCVICDECHYAANLEVAVSNVQSAIRQPESKPLEEIYTPNVKTIDELMLYLGVPENRLLKSLMYVHDNKPILVLMLGNDQVNEMKLSAVVRGDVRPIHPDELKILTGADAGSIGPVGINEGKSMNEKIKIFADLRTKGANNLISGANKNDYHIGNIDMMRDVVVDGFFDLRLVQNGEECIYCKKSLRVVNAIELGHIFKLGTKYSEALDATYLDEYGKEKPIVMGSYGIGVERLIACYIEQNHDQHGIIWNKALTPFHVQLITVNTNNEQVVKTAENLYDTLQRSLIDVLYDDRVEVSPGFKFKDADLLGMPLQIIVSEKNIMNEKVEIKERRTGKRHLVELSSVANFVEKYLEP